MAIIIKVSVLESIRKEKKIEIVDHCIVPGWISNSTCPICQWGIHESNHEESIIAGADTSGQVYFFHKSCFKRQY